MDNCSCLHSTDQQSSAMFDQALWPLMSKPLYQGCALFLLSAIFSGLRAIPFSPFCSLNWYNGYFLHFCRVSKFHLLQKIFECTQSSLQTPQHPELEECCQAMNEQELYRRMHTDRCLGSSELLRQGKTSRVNQNLHKHRTTFKTTIKVWSIHIDSPLPVLS